MKNKLDKNSKLPSGKSKEASSSDAKSKAKAGKPAPKAPPAASAKKAKSIPESKPSKAASHSKSTPPAKPSKPEAAPKAKSAKPPSQANRETQAPVSKRPAAGKAARPRAKTGSEGSARELSLEEFAISLIKPGENKERIWRTKTFHQQPAQRDFGFPDVAPELPGQYNQPKLVLMPKDPEYMFCYWELTSTLIEEKAREKLPNGNYRETLKINWESKSLFEPNFTFIPVFFWARKWYFGVPQVGQRYQVELGWLSDSGHFISIIRSNLSELPESWAVTQKRLSEQGEVLAYSSNHTKTLGSSEHLVVEDIRSFVPEWNLSSESMTSSSWSRGPGAPEADAPSAGAAADKPTHSGGKTSKSRPASPKARLEISGKVLAGISVSVGGKSLPIDAQGYFKIELPYNKDTLKLQLTSSDGATRSFTYDLKELVLN